MRTYEAVCVFRPEEDAFKSGTESVRNELKSLGAEISKEEDMGQRTLAYPIKKYNQAHYYLFVVEMEPEKAHQSEEHLKLRTDMLRFLIVRQED